jgi:hypothetical protein
MKHFHHIYIDLYGFDIYFIRCRRAMYERKIETEFDLEAPVKQNKAATSEIYQKDGRLIGVIWLCETATHAHLAHEVFHAVHFFLQNRGLSLTDASEEAYAYLIQWMFEKIEAVLFRGRK